MITPINTTNAPAAVGPYSQAIRFDRLVCTSGQIPLDPATGAVPSDDIDGQARQALENLKAVLAASGAGLENVIKTTVFIRDMSLFGTVNTIYAEYFSGAVTPARSCVEVSALPKGVLIEIEAVAVAPEEAK